MAAGVADFLLGFAAAEASVHDRTDNAAIETARMNRFMAAGGVAIRGTALLNKEQRECAPVATIILRNSQEGGKTGAVEE